MSRILECIICKNKDGSNLTFTSIQNKQKHLLTKKHKKNLSLIKEENINIVNNIVDNSIVDNNIVDNNIVDDNIVDDNIVDNNIIDDNIVDNNIINDNIDINFLEEKNIKLKLEIEDLKNEVSRLIENNKKLFEQNKNITKKYNDIVNYIPSNYKCIVNNEKIIKEKILDNNENIEICIVEEKKSNQPDLNKIYCKKKKYDKILDCSLTYYYDIDTNDVFEMNKPNKYIGKRIHFDEFCKRKNCKNKGHWCVERINDLKFYD